MQQTLVSGSGIYKNMGWMLVFCLLTSSWFNEDPSCFTCSTSSSVMGWVWNRFWALRWRVSPRAPSAGLPVVWERRVKSAIFSVKLRVERSGSSGNSSCPSPSTPAVGAWAGFCDSWLSFSWSWSVEPGWEEAWRLGGWNQWISWGWKSTNKHFIYLKSHLIYYTNLPTYVNLSFSQLLFSRKSSKLMHTVHLTKICLSVSCFSRKTWWAEKSNVCVGVRECGSWPAFLDGLFLSYAWSL